MMVVHRLSPFGRYQPATGAPPMLVIDDDPEGAGSTLATLAGAGYAAVAESNGDAALALVRSDLIRLVVSELHIPCSEGPCVVAALKQERARLPRLRVLVHTRHTAAADSEWALACGCDTLVHRGVAPELLIREVRRLDGEFLAEPAP
jgi:CheY-like chemotaxis protein